MDPHQYLNSFHESIASYPILTSVLIASTILIAFLITVLFRNNENDDDKLPSNTAKNDSTTTKSSPPLKDIFSRMRSLGTSSTKSKKPFSDDRPFSSSYYYAHNNPKTVGYKDGLRMEDYTMNQPRLLSKNGVPIDDANESSEQKNDEMEGEINSDEQQNEKEEKIVSTQSKSKPSSVPITKFSWEDAHEYARIRIDSIPSPNNTTTNKTYICWEEASISKSQVTVQLQTKYTLSIELYSSKFNQSYHLRFQSLYAGTKEAQAFWRQNKLIVRLKKIEKKEWKDLVQKDPNIDEALFRANE